MRPLQFTTDSLDNRDLMDRVHELARQKLVEPAPGRLVALLKADGGAGLVPFEIAARQMGASPLFPQNVAAEFRSPEAARVCIEIYLTYGVRCIVVDGFDPGKLQTASRNLQASIIDTQVAQRLAGESRTLHICHALLHLSLRSTR